MTMNTMQTEIETPAGEPVIRVRRFFKAPPELVYKACTEADYIRRWMGPRRLEVSECEVDVRVGGTWRLVHRAPDGAEFVFYGELLELDPPRRRVYPNADVAVVGTPDVDGVGQRICRVQTDEGLVHIKILVDVEDFRRLQGADQGGI